MAAMPLAVRSRSIGKRSQRATVAPRFADFLQAIRSLPAGQLWRHNQAGDLPHSGGRISRRFIRGIVAANRGRRGFTYTHHDLSKGENLPL
jgi:hypothetical protein